MDDFFFFHKCTICCLFVLFCFWLSFLLVEIGILVQLGIFFFLMGSSLKRHECTNVKLI